MPRGRPAHVCACKDCGRTRRHYAGGYCASCYARRRFAAAPKVECSRCHQMRFHFAGKMCRGCYRTERKFQQKYGITYQDFDVMLAAQGGTCVICSNGFGERKPHVDHCHATGMARGLLCYKCNVGLGSFGDDPERLRAAAKYIEAHRARKVA